MSRPARRPDAGRRRAAAVPACRVPSPARASAARRTIDALSAGVDVFEHFFDNVRVGLALADLTTRYVRVNDTYAALLGRPPEDLVGVPFSEVVHPDDATAPRTPPSRLLSRARATRWRPRSATSRPTAASSGCCTASPLVRDATGARLVRRQRAGHHRAPAGRGGAAGPDRRRWPSGRSATR